jgi:protein phosphatase
MNQTIQFAGATDIGAVRLENQDRWLVLPDLRIAAVADGMGGMPFGSEAAQAAIDTLTYFLGQHLPATPREWRMLLGSINRKIHALGCELSPDTGIGTTLTVAHCAGLRLTIAHVGDSAAFLLRNNVLSQLTQEHTVAAEHRALGRTPPPHSEHMLSSCMGLALLPKVDINETELQPGDRLLLCSDGLCKPASSAEMAAVLAGAESPGAAAAALLPLGRYGGDNITAVVGFVGET